MLSILAKRTRSEEGSLFSPLTCTNLIFLIMRGFARMWARATISEVVSLVAGAAP